MYPLWTRFVSGICVWIPCIKETMMMMMMMIIVIIIIIIIIIIPQSVLRQVHQLLPERVLHTVRYSGSYFNFQYPLFSLWSSSSCLRLLRLPVLSTYPYNFPSITCFRRQFLCKMWPTELTFFRYISRRKRQE